MLTLYDDIVMFTLSLLLPYSLSLSFSTVVVDGLVGQFIQIPSSQNLTLGETAAFVCRHRSADHIIWEVTPRWLYDQFEQASRGGEYTLSAHLEDGIDYNATTVQCVAVLDDSHLISSEPATLLVQGKSIHLNIRVFNKQFPEVMLK